MRTFFETIFGKSGQSDKTDILHFVLTSNIVRKDDTEAGLINRLDLTEGVKFLPISLSEKPEIVSRHRGIAKAEQYLKLHFSNPGTVFTQLSKAKNANLTVSILHTNELGHSFLYGENIGLSVEELSEEFVVLEGEEADIFYKVDADLVTELTA